MYKKLSRSQASVMWKLKNTDEHYRLVIGYKILTNKSCIFKRKDGCTSYNRVSIATINALLKIGLINKGVFLGISGQYYCITNKGKEWSE
jgi:hypothetical protein